MATIVIRQVPDEVVAALDLLADQEDRSRESYSRRLVAEHTKKKDMMYDARIFYNAVESLAAQQPEMAMDLLKAVDSLHEVKIAARGGNYEGGLAAARQG